MADAQTMQAYAENIEAYKSLVGEMPENPHLENFVSYLAAGCRHSGFWVRCWQFCRQDARQGVFHDLHGCLA